MCIDSFPNDNDCHSLITISCLCKSYIQSFNKTIIYVYCIKIVSIMYRFVSICNDLLRLNEGFGGPLAGHARGGCLVGILSKKVISRFSSAHRGVGAMKKSKKCVGAMKKVKKRL